MWKLLFAILLTLVLQLTTNLPSSYACFHNCCPCASPPGKGGGGKPHPKPPSVHPPKRPSVHPPKPPSVHPPSPTVHPPSPVHPKPPSVHKKPPSHHKPPHHGGGGKKPGCPPPPSTPPVLPPPVLPPPVLPPPVLTPPILPPPILPPPVLPPPILPPPVLPPPALPPPVTPTPTRACPIDTLKLSACVDLLGGLIHIGIGPPVTQKCCPLLQGLADLDAALCLCTTLRAKLLNLNIFLPIALSLLVDCGKHPPSDYQCPPLLS